MTATAKSDLIQNSCSAQLKPLVGTYLGAFAYKKVKFVLKHKAAQNTEDAVSKELTQKLGRLRVERRLGRRKMTVLQGKNGALTVRPQHCAHLRTVLSWSRHCCSFFTLKNLTSSGIPALLSTSSDQTMSASPLVLLSGVCGLQKKYRDGLW
uniref:Uncharacterized protein n=1 Tax=Oryctolagus cuniculus TaxID=9986 RepID=A0A5F9DDM3_RABIT